MWKREVLHNLLETRKSLKLVVKSKIMLLKNVVLCKATYAQLNPQCIQL